MRRSPYPPCLHKAQHLSADYADLRRCPRFHLRESAKSADMLCLLIFVSAPSEEPTVLGRQYGGSFGKVTDGLVELLHIDGLIQVPIDKPGFHL